MLEPNIYDLAEGVGRLKLAYGHHSWIDSASPEVFNKVGHSLSAENLASLQRFVESMHDDRFDLFRDYLGGLVTEAELNAFLSALRMALRVQHTYMNRTSLIVPLEVGAASLVASSFVSQILVQRDSPSIVEIGAGSGFIPSMLGFPVRTYFSIDVSKPYYLLQSMYMHGYCDKVIEMADPRCPHDTQTTPLHSIRYFNGKRINSISITHVDSQSVGNPSSTV